MQTKQFYVIAYDITSDRRRQKVAKTLETYGMRCNFSVFEVMVTEMQMAKIQKALKKIIDPSVDSILYYYLCKSCVGKRDGIGRKVEVVEEVIVV